MVVEGHDAPENLVVLNVSRLLWETISHPGYVKTSSALHLPATRFVRAPAPL